MSAEAARWVREESTARGIDRAVLAALAWHHHAASGRCDPSVARIAAEVGIHVRTVIRALRRLEQSGDLKVDVGTGRATSSYHFPRLPVVVTPRHPSGVAESQVSGVAESHPRGDSESRSGDSESRSGDSPPANREIERKRTTRAREENRTVAPPPASDLSGSADDDAAVLRRYLDAIARDPEPEPLPVATNEERDRVYETVRGLRDSLGFRTRRDPS